MLTTQVYGVLTTWRVWRLIRVTIGPECQRGRLSCFAYDLLSAAALPIVLGLAFLWERAERPQGP